jgi:hypothetical protein
MQVWRPFGCKACQGLLQKLLRIATDEGHARQAMLLLIVAYNPVRENLVATMNQIL